MQPTSHCPKCTTKLFNNAIVLSVKKLPIKTTSAIQAALPQDIVLPSHRTIRRRLFRVNLKPYRTSKGLNCLRRTLLTDWHFAKNIKHGRLNKRGVLCFQTKHNYPSFMLFVGTFNDLPRRRLSLIHRFHGEEYCKSNGAGVYLSKGKMWVMVYA